MYGIILILFTSGATVVTGQTLNESTTLMTDMLTGYDRRQRPILNQSAAIEVTAEFNLVALQDIDEVKETFSVNGILSMYWYDEIITWNSSSYGGITSQLYQLTDIWYPILYLANPYDSAYSDDSTWMKVTIEESGLARFSLPLIFKAKCGIDVGYYPFDKQNCYLLFSPAGYTAEALTLISGRSDVIQTQFIPGGEWGLKSTKASVTDDCLRIDFYFQRKPLFLIVNIMLPIMCLTFINVFAFMLPPASGERVGYSVTCLLAIAVFLTLVGDNLPKTSQPFPIMCYYLMFVLMISLMICVGVICNLRLFFAENDKPVSSWGRFLIRVATLSCKQQNQSNAVSPIKKESNGIQGGGLESVKAVGKGSKSNHHDTTVKSHDKDIEVKAAVTWQDVSNAVDTLCCMACFSSIVLTTIVFLSLVMVG